MTTDVATLERVANELHAASPVRVEGTNAGLTYPHLQNLQMSNFVRFYHPDGSYSDIAAPTVNPKRPQTAAYLERFLVYYLKKTRNGEPWFFLTPQKEAPVGQYKCFIEIAPGFQCTKRLHSLDQLFMHVMSRHSEQAKMYTDAISRLQARMQKALDPDLLKAIGLEEGDEDAVQVMADTPEIYRCGVQGCSRFFDTAQARDMHESGPKSPHRKGKK